MKTILMLASLCALAACGASEPHAQTPSNTVNTATASAPSTQKVVLIDVRSPEEFQAGHLPHAHNIVHDKINQQISSLNIDKNAEIHVYCRSGSRAGVALKTLQDMGYTNVKNLGAYDDLKNKYINQ